jgi:hypothetical protein
MVVQASFEDFIYIALGLVWVIYSAYSAKKKQKAKNNPTSASKNKSFLETIIGEMGLPSAQTESDNRGQEEDDEYKFDVDESKITPSVEPQELYSYDDEYEESNYVDPYNVIETKTVVDTNNVDANIVKIPKELVDNDYTIKKKKSIRRIDLRRAVIYSVILKKVDF